MLAPPPTSHDALINGLERLDVAAATDFVEALVEGGTPLSEILSTALLPAWEQLYGRVAVGESDAAAIGAAAAVGRRALAAATRLAEPTPADRRVSIAVVSPAGSAELFGAELLSELVACDGWPVETLCAPTPEELTAYQRGCAPAAVVITAHEAASLPGLAAQVGVAHAARIPVLAWGPAFGSDDRRARSLGVEGWAPTAAGATSLLAGWADRPPAVGGAPSLGGAYTEVRRLRPSLLDVATGVGGESQAVSAWVERAAASLVDHLAASVALGDPSIIAEHLERERRSARRRDLDDVHLVGLVDAVAAALPLTSVVAREYIFTSREDLRRALMGVPRVDRPAGPRAEATTDGSPAPAAPPAPTSAGQAFADILLLAALACQTPYAVLSVPQAGGGWSTLSYGFEERSGLNDPRLFELVASQVEPFELADMTAHPELAKTPFAQAPHHLRWVYATALRGQNGQVVGVIAVLDRWLREPGRREQRAMQAVARQATAQLGHARKANPQAAWTGPAPAGGPGWQGTAAAPGPVAATGRPDPLAALRRATSLQEGQQLLRSHEVAVLFDVTERTVINWAAAGKLPSLRTIGGHLRFRSEDVLELLAGRTTGGTARRS